MDRLAGLDALVVRQRVETAQAGTGFETANRYVLATPQGVVLFTAVEAGGSFLARDLLKVLRPFTIHVLDADGSEVLRLRRPFRLYFHRLEVSDARGGALGCVQRRFSLLWRIFSVQDAAGEELFELFGPILQPWTFEIRRRGLEVGKITKKWSGLFKEAVADADNFAVVFPADADVRARALLVGAVFLIDFIDFCYFKNKGNS